MRQYKTSPKQSNPMKFGSTPEKNAQGMGRARAQKQQKLNTQHNGGRPPRNFGISPDSPGLGFSPYPTFRTAGLSAQNSNSSSKNGNNNLAVGNENKKYDICATNPSSPVCSGTGITSKLPVAGQKAKSKKGGRGRSGKRSHSRKTKIRKTNKRKTNKRKTKRRKTNKRTHR